MKGKKGIMCLAALGTAAYFLCGCRRGNRHRALVEENNRYTDNYFLLNHWLEAKNNGKSTADFFLENGYRDMAIYGMGELANRLCEELQGTEVHVRYGIDREPCGTVSRMDRIYTPDEKLEDVDAVIVTPFYAMESIRSALKEKVSCPILSIEEVVWSL